MRLSDIALPTATWYEKNDLNTTDMHPFIHPLSEAVSPAWESMSDWQIFKNIAKTFSKLAEKHLGTRKDLVALPMQHDSPFELAQPLGQVKDWKRGECEPVPGKTMPLLKLIERDYGQIYNKFIALGPLMVKVCTEQQREGEIASCPASELGTRALGDRDDVVRRSPAGLRPGGRDHRVGFVHRDGQQEQSVQFAHEHHQPC